MGSSLAAPDRQIIGITGDGGLLFTATGLAVAAAEHLSMAIVVFDNSGYGEIRAEMLERDEKPTAVDAPPRDLVLLAQALGARGISVETPDALVRAPGGCDPSEADGAGHQRTASTGRITPSSTDDSYLELTWTERGHRHQGLRRHRHPQPWRCRGGLRMRDGVTLDEVRDLAEAMTERGRCRHAGERVYPSGWCKGRHRLRPLRPSCSRRARQVRPRHETADRSALRHR